ncbi:MAG: diadenylate cyclase CdaA [Dehalococcoidia bacterium]
MPEYFHSFVDTFRRIDARSLLDIILIAAVIYWSLLWLRGTSAMSLLRGVAIVVAVAALLGGLFDLTVVNWLLRNSLTALLVALPIIFQPEIRRALERVGRTGMRSWRGHAPSEGMANAITAAALELAKLRHGALIILEGETGLEDFVATGVRLDAVPSVPLLRSIFYVNSAMHDGAVIIRGGRISAASCTLPLSEAGGRGHSGTRHRAALGISERTDALAVVVSEETGGISIAANGRLIGPLDEDRLDVLLNGFIQQPSGPPSGRSRAIAAVNDDAAKDPAAARLSEHSGG